VHLIVRKCLIETRLCHNVHGPHDQHFHALWNQLRDEHEALVRKGYTGEGFLSEGKRLGGQRIPMDEARRRARAAAEKRRNLTAGSGQRLGGAPVLRGTDMRKVIADAAQRRMTVERGCASGTKAGQKLSEEVSKGGFRTKAEEDDANEQAIMIAYIDLIQEEEKEKYGDSYVPPSASNPLGSRGTISPPPVPHDSKPLSTNPSNATNTENSVGLSDKPKEDDSWECPICTLQNPWNYLCCDACTTERPEWLHPPPKTQSQSKAPQKQSGQSASLAQDHRVLKPRNNALQSLASLEATTPQKPLGWLCHRCGQFMESEWWTCASCGTMKQSS
jgi:DNA-dependent metalloprotease WSS1